MQSNGIRNNLKLSILFTLLIFCLEIVGGFWANSLALLSDAAHMFMDSFSLCLSWCALMISDRPSTNTKTFGYHRVEILVALLNGFFLLLIALGILYEAFQRFSHPEEVKSRIVLVVACVGLLTNLTVIYLLKGQAHHHDHGHQHDLNIKSAFYHVVGDSLASVAVIAGSVIMIYTQWYTLDAIIGASVGLLLIWGAKNIILEAFHILLEGVPKGLSIQDVERELTSIPAIKNVHELHIWSICSNVYALSTHALVNDQKVNEAASILNEVRDRLKAKFNISHSTIQFESTPCSEASTPCNFKH